MCTHLNRTGAKYYFRRPVPKDLRGFFLTATGKPRAEWKISLGVTDRAQAKELLRPYQEETDELIREAREQMNRASSLEPLEAGQREREEREALAVVEADKRARYANRERVRVLLRQRMQLSTAELTTEEAAARDLIREREQDHEKLRETVAFLESRIGELGGTVAFSAARHSAGGRTLEQLIEAYEADKSPGWGGSSKKAVAPVFRLLRDVFPGRLVSSITRADAREVLRLLEVLPTQIGKRKELKGLTIREAIQRGKVMGLPTIQPKTINDGYLLHVASMFNWACKEQWIASSPFTGLSVHDPVSDAERRDPFTADQLKVLFSASPWSAPWSADFAKPGPYWVPLLCLFHGLRNGEAAGLRVEDIGEDDGVPVIRIRAYDGKSLKTKEARGTLPVHPVLGRMGFLAFVAARREAGETLLFPEGVANARGQIGAKLGERFSAHVKRLGFTGRKLGTHSFRHCFEDRLRAAELAERTALALARRSEAGSSRVYGDGLSVRQMAEAIAKVSYPGLDLSHLYAADEAGEVYPVPPLRPHSAVEAGL
jgi:integrase